MPERRFVVPTFLRAPTRRWRASTGWGRIAALWIAALTALCAADAAANAARAEEPAEGLEDHLGPMARGVALGAHDGWTLSVAKGWFMMSAGPDVAYPNSYRIVSSNRSPLSGDLTVKVNLALRADDAKFAGAGLLFNVDGDDFLAAVIDKTGHTQILKQSNGALTLASPLDKDVVARMDGGDILEMTVSGATARFRLNGEELNRVQVGAPMTNSYGIIAVGKGRFAFTGLTATREVKAEDDFPPPAPPDDDATGPKADDSFPPPVADDRRKRDDGAPDDAAPDDAPDDAATDDAADGAPTAAEFELWESELKKISEEERRGLAKLVGATLGIFFHELAHALIGEIGVPATGPEEDVADEFAAYIMAEIFHETEFPSGSLVEAYMENMAKYSVLLWYYDAIHKEKQGSKHPWQDEHSPSPTRFRHMLCIVYGGNPERYAQLAATVDLGERTQKRCIYEYDKRKTAWETILKPYARKLDDDVPADNPADAPGGSLKVAFTPPRSEVGRALETFLKNGGFMTNIATQVERAFVWPRDLQIRVQDCDVMNAWYDPQDHSITLCYQIIEFYVTLVNAYESGDGSSGGGSDGGGSGGSGSGGGSASGGGGSGSGGGPVGGTPTIAQYLVGVWTTTIPSPSGPIPATLEIQANGSYGIVMDTPVGRMQAVGSWSVSQAAGSSQNQWNLSAVPQQWSPPQICAPDGQCDANPLSEAETTLFSVIDANHLTVDGAVWTRSTGQ